MPSNDGSQEPLVERARRPLNPEARERLTEELMGEEPLVRRTTTSLTELRELLGRQARQEREPTSGLTSEELVAIASGEPYCFRCGRPASSFSEYQVLAEVEDLPNAWQYVIQEEGTYNNDTNRFACDGCYIAIGMPAGPTGWTAP